MTICCCILQALWVLLAPALAKEMSLRTYLWWPGRGMWTTAGRMWWACGSYPEAMRIRVLPFSLLCRVSGCSAPSHTHALVRYPFVLCNAQSGSCYMPPLNSCINTKLLWTPFSLTPSRTLWKSTLPSLASPIVWTPKLHCLLHGVPYAPQIQPHPFFSLFSFVQSWFLPTALCFCWLTSMLNSHCRAGVHRGRE